MSSCGLICFCEQPHQNSGEKVEKKNILLLMARREKLSSVWSFKDYLYEACGETTLNHSLSEHKKHSC